MDEIKDVAEPASQYGPLVARDLGGDVGTGSHVAGTELVKVVASALPPRHGRLPSRSRRSRARSIRPAEPPSRSTRASPRTRPRAASRRRSEREARGLVLGRGEYRARITVRNLQPQGPWTV